MAHAMQSDTCRSLGSSGGNYSSGSSAGSLAGHSAGSKTSPSRRKRSSLTIPKPFNLSLHSRVEERMKYDAVQKHRQEEEEKLCRERKEAEQEQARKEMKKKVGFKANRVRIFKSVSIQPSNRPPTKPESPILLTSLLSEMRKAETDGAAGVVGEGGRVRGRSGSIGRKRRVCPASSTGSSERAPHLLSSCAQETDGLEPVECHVVTMETMRKESPDQIEPQATEELPVATNNSETTRLEIFGDVAAVVAYYLLIYYTVYLVCS